MRAWYDRRRGERLLLFSWLLTRLLILLVMLREVRMGSDVPYYHRKIAALSDVGLERTFFEYPTPVTWILWLPYGLTGGSRLGYYIGFVVLMLALDAVFTWALWRSSGRRHGKALDFWLLFVLLVGPLCYLRFDLLPAVLAGGALLAARRRPWLTGALTGLGAAVKLWPALLVGAFLAHRPTRGPVTWGFVAVGFGLALISLLTGGWARLVSPLTWQSDRGLQIESIWATPVMLARAVGVGGYSVAMSKYQAYEITGAGVGVLVLASDLATVVGLLLVVALLVRAFRHPAPTAVALGLVVLATVAIMIVTNKTLSPQYLLWLGGVMAALLLLREDDRPEEQRALGRLAAQLLVLALLTHLVFPLLYSGLLGSWGAVMVAVSTVVTAARNVFLVVFAVEATRMAWQRLRPPETTIGR